MKHIPPKRIGRKRGPDRNETARHPRKAPRGFSQSKDIHEDRGERQIKLATPLRTPGRARGGAFAVHPWPLDGGPG